MQEFMLFITHHMMLVDVLAVVVVLLLILEGLKVKKGKKGVTITEAVALINRNNAIIIDIRPKEVFQKGHILNAQSCTAKEIETDFKKFEKYKNKPTILVCSMGLESQKLASQMKQEESIYYLLGGMRAWTDANMPVHTE